MYMPFKVQRGSFLSVGQRLRDERARLGMSQPAFAALAGASKGAQQNWEKDAASPNAAALIAWAEAGADVLYILTGRRTADRPENAATQIEDQLAAIRRDIIDPSRSRLPHEDEQQTERRVLEQHTNALAAILRYDKALLTPELLEEVDHLHDIVTNPSAVSLIRAADFAQLRVKRRDMKARLADWLEGGFVPGDTVMNLLVTMAMEYAVPVKFLAELVEELHDDVARRS